MTKETKIGLFVGLAFIVLFAVIISGNGGNGAPRNQPADFGIARAEKENRDNPPTAPSPALDGGRMAVERMLPQPKAQPSLPKPAGPAAPADDSSPLRRIDNELPTLPESQIAVDQPKPGPLTPGVIKSDPLDGLADAGNSVIKIPVEPLPREPKLMGVRENEETPADKLKNDPRFETLAGGAKPSTLDKQPDRGMAEPKLPPVANKLADNQPAPSSKGTKTHVVQPGDTLSGIAAAKFRSRDPKYVAMLVEANKSVITDRNRLTVGKELVIPVVASDASNLANAGAEPAKPQPRKAGPPIIPPALKDKKDAVAAKPKTDRKPDRPGRTVLAAGGKSEKLSVKHAGRPEAAPRKADDRARDGKSAEKAKPVKAKPADTGTAKSKATPAAREKAPAKGKAAPARNTNKPPARTVRT